MRSLTKMELDTLRWVRDANGPLFSSKRRKTFQKLVDLGLITMRDMSYFGTGAVNEYKLTTGGDMVLSSYDGPRRVVSTS